MIHYLPDGRAYCDCGCEFCMMNPSRLDPIEGSDDRLATRHRATREKALVAALASTLKLVELFDLAAAIRIVDQLCASVLPLDGEPIVLHCSEMIPIVHLVEFEEGRIACETIEEYLRERDGGAR
jgi:hypothetical protein